MGPIDRLAALYDVYGIYLLATLTEYGKQSMENSFNNSKNS